VHDVTVFAKAVFAGFVVAVPIGAIGLICLRRAFLGKWLDGVMVGFGAAAADAVLAAMAAFGLSLATQYLIDHKVALRIIGGMILICLGVKIILDRNVSTPAYTQISITSPQRWRQWLSDVVMGFGLTIINPATLIAFVGVFAGLGLFAADIDTLLEQWSVVLGAFAGSTLWWVTLTGVATLMRHHLSGNALRTMNGILGSLVVLTGMASLGSVAGLEV
jgi:threonine/homoserine/homoserine lactone efflux protein